MTPLSWVLLAFPVYLLVKGQALNYLKLVMPDNSES